MQGVVHSILDHIVLIYLSKVSNKFVLLDILFLEVLEKTIIRLFVFIELLRICNKILLGNGKLRGGINPF